MTDDAFRQARDYLLAHRGDYQTADGGFAWPEAAEFNGCSRGLHADCGGRETGASYPVGHLSTMY